MSDVPRLSFVRIVGVVVTWSALKMKVYSEEGHRIERDKEFTAFLKHLSTLNTGSIGLIAVFAKDFGAAVRQHPFPLKIAVGALVLSLVLTLACYAISLFRFFGFSSAIRQRNIRWAKAFSLILMLAAALFVVAMACVGYTATKIFAP